VNVPLQEESIGMPNTPVTVTLHPGLADADVHEEPLTELCTEM
jgi:hypothetical protein